MLAPRVLDLLVLQHHQAAADALPRLVRQDHVVDEAPAACHEGVGEAGLVLGLARGQLGGVVLVLAEDDLHGALGAHHRDLRVGPGQVHVAAQVLGGHHVVGAAVGLARDHGDLGHGGLGIRVQQLGAVLDDAAVLLAGAGHEAGHVHVGHDGDVEGIAEAHEARGLDAGLDVQAARQHQRLVRHDAHHLPVHAAEADDDVARVVGLQLEEVAVVHRLGDQLLHVVGLVGVLGHQGVQAQVLAVGRIGAPAHRGLLAVVERQVVVQAPQHHERLHVVLEGHVGHAAARGVGDGAAQFLRRDLLVRHGLHHLGPGDEHVARILHHEDEVRHGGRIDRAARAGAHHHADLRDHARSHHVLLEHVRIAAQGRHAFLDARAARIVQADHRGADLHGLVHDLADLLGMRLRQRAAEHGEVLAEDEDEAAIDHAVARHHPVAGDFLVLHPEVRAAVLDEHVPFLEGAVVQQQFDALARGELAFLVLRLDALRAAALAGLLALFLQLFQDVLHGLPSNDP